MYLLSFHQLFYDIKDVFAHLSQEWGLLNQFPSFQYFTSFSELSKHWLPIKHHVHIWQMSPMFRCDDISQIWIWCKIKNLIGTFMKISVARKLTNGALVTPIPGHREHCTIAPELINHNVKYMGLNDACKTTIKREPCVQILEMCSTPKIRNFHE